MCVRACVRACVCVYVCVCVCVCVCVVQVDENEPLQAGSPHSMLNAVLGSVMCRRNLMLNHCARKYSIQNLVNRSFFTLQLFQFHYENDFSVACK